MQYIYLINKLSVQLDGTPRQDSQLSLHMQILCVTLVGFPKIKALPSRLMGEQAKHKRSPSRGGTPRGRTGDGGITQLRSKGGSVLPHRDTRLTLHVHVLRRPLRVSQTTRVVE